MRIPQLAVMVVALFGVARGSDITQPAGDTSEAATKRIVFFGSSTCAGTGATTYAQSWAGLLTAAMPSYTFVNKSIPGNSTGDLIARFYTDVAPQRPRYVILCSSVFNEAFAGDPVTAAATFKTNTLRLVKMIQGLRAVPVVMGQIANDQYTAQGCKILRDIYDWQNSLGVQVFDGLSVTEDVASMSTCAFLSGASADGIHPNDTYHAAMYSTVIQSYFDTGRSINVGPQTLTGSTWIYGSDTSNTPLQVTAPTGSASWSAAFWTKDNVTGSKAFFQAGGSTGPLRIRNPADVYELIQTGDTITSTVSTLNRLWHHQVVTYHYPTKTLCYYIDGGLIDTCKTGGTQFAVTYWAFLGRPDATASNCVSCQLAQVGIWQSSLQADDVKDIYAGRIPIKSLLWFAPLTEQPRVNPFSLSGSNTLGVAYTTTNGFTYGIPFSLPYLAGRSASIGGGALTAACATGTVAVAGAATEMAATASPDADITTGGTVAFSVWARVSSANTVTVYVCGTGTPTATTYRVRAIP